MMMTHHPTNRLVRVRTSNSGSLLEAHDYYPFGLDMPGRSSTGTPVRQGFTGYWRDGENGLGLYYSGARMYSPGTGRFFGVDGRLSFEVPVSGLR